MNLNRRPIYAAILLGLVITLSQILFTCLLSGSNQPVEAYFKLFQWDSKWYGHIVDLGYRSTIPPIAQNWDISNVAFFPGYPLIAKAFKDFFGLSTPLAMLLVAQLACWGFWTYLFLFFQRWQISTRLAAGSVIAILVHPSAFFLVAGYSESLFLMMLLGFLYWTNSTRLSSWFLAASHGFVMTATRIVGLPLALYPLFNFWILSVLNKPDLNQQPQKSTTKYLVISGISSLGCILFFAFCYLKFGQWDLYMKTQLIGWGIKPNYLAILEPTIYLPPNRTPHLSRLSVPATMVLFLMSWVAEWRAAKVFKEKSWQQRAGFYFCGWLMFYLSVCGLSSDNMQSMIRYTLCVYVMLVLAMVHLLSRIQLFKPVSKNWVAFLLFFLATVSLIIQSGCAYRFTHGVWIA